MTYREYLKSYQWKNKRKKVLTRDKNKCRYCGSRARLEVHHLTYDRIFNERLSDLITLCHNCHSKVHNKKK